MHRIHIILLSVSLSVLGVHAPAHTADNAPARTVTLKVENMSCTACPATVRKTLEKVPGVAAVKTDFATKSATVTFDPTKTGVETLTRATAEAGYPSALAP